ncbi:sarcosine oxidase subunit gamma [Rhodobacteraceae bacterium CCMM004]|nr:sarcosine oxidase subunit gamma [Rhodobacteraceae bacterium CCMM004]
MSEIATALGGARSDGLCTVCEVPPLGMIQIRADLGATAVRDAVAEGAGVAVPDVLRATTEQGRTLCWFSPDEVLLILPRGEAPSALSALAEAMEGHHHLAADVSDMRAVLRVEGRAVRDVLAKLTPADMAPGAFPPGSVRRTRLGQIAAAVRMVEDETVEILCFRSVARYAFDLMTEAAREGGAVGYFDREA